MKSTDVRYIRVGSPVRAGIDPSPSLLPRPSGSAAHAAAPADVVQRSHALKAFELLKHHADIGSRSRPLHSRAALSSAVNGRGRDGSATRGRRLATCGSKPSTLRLLRDHPFHESSIQPRPPQRVCGSLTCLPRRDCIRCSVGYRTSRVAGGGGPSCGQGQHPKAASKRRNRARVDIKRRSAERSGIRARST